MGIKEWFGIEEEKKEEIDSPLPKQTQSKEDLEAVGIRAVGSDDEYEPQPIEHDSMEDFAKLANEPTPPEPREILSMDPAFENEKIPEISENLTFKLQLFKNLIGEDLSPELMGKLFTVVRMAPLGGEDDAIKASIDLIGVIPKNISQEKQNYLRATLPNLVKELQKDLGYYPEMEKGDNLRYLQRFQILIDRTQHEVMDIIKPAPVLEEPSTAEWDEFHEKKARFEELHGAESETPVIQMKREESEDDQNQAA